MYFIFLSASEAPKCHGARGSLPLTAPSRRACAHHAY